MFRGLIIFIFTFISVICLSQSEIEFSFSIFSNGTIFSKTNNKVIIHEDTTIINKVRFYISNIKLFNNSEVVWIDEPKAYLIDFDSDNNFNLPITSKLAYDELQFDLGIDSLKNVSGALAGDLDPTNGMYWSWQSGYINFKLEGYKNNLEHRRNLFQLHLGGYLSPFNALTTCSFSINNKKRINIIFDLELFIESIDIKEQDNIMRPCKEGVEISSLISKAIYLND